MTNEELARMRWVAKKEPAPKSLSAQLDEIKDCEGAKLLQEQIWRLGEKWGKPWEYYND